MNGLGNGSLVEEKAIASFLPSGDKVGMPGAKTDLLSEVTRVLKMEGDAILSCLARLNDPQNRAQFENALKFFQKALDQGGKLVITGVGKSGKVGEKIAATLCSTGSLAVFLHPTDGLHGDLGVVASKDAILALSYSGNTEELVRLLPSLKSLRIPVVGLGGNRQSKLAQQCDAWIDGSVDQEACPHNLAPTSSTTVALALGDAIAVALMQIRGFDARSFAQNHPGGSLGRRLHLKVSDVMHSGDSVATVAADASIDEVLLTLTRKSLGAALVVNATLLLGIITEGDIRRALQHREKFFSLKASVVMTRTPICTSPEDLASSAFELMENRPKQISVLPVVDSQGHWKGLVRIHDLVKIF